jgi:hypothetical protein
MPEFEHEELEYEEEENAGEEAVGEEAAVEESAAETQNVDEEKPTSEAEAVRNLNKADRIVEHLFSEEQQSTFQDPQYLNEGIFQADVENNISQFNSLVEFCEWSGLPFPCIYIGNQVPIPVDFAPPIWLDKDFDRYFYRELIYMQGFHPRIRKYFSEGSEVEIKNVKAETAVGHFKQLLKGFLSSRIGAASSLGNNSADMTHKPTQPPGTTPPTNGVPFRVITTTLGLRVHYSPAYFFNPNLVFGSRTSPVNGFIHPGRYIFGVAGGGIHGVKFSRAEFDIPGQTQADLLEL